MSHTCAGCGANFTPERKNQRSCSPACRKLAYEHGDKARARKKRYEASAKRKAASEKYAASSKGKVRHLRHYYKDRPKELQVVLKNRAKWTKDVHAYAAEHGVRLPLALGVLRGWRRSVAALYVEGIPSLKWKRTDLQRNRFLSRWYWKLREEECRTGR
jgi:hypothetical protein